MSGPRDKTDAPGVVMIAARTYARTWAYIRGITQVRTVAEMGSQAGFDARGYASLPPVSSEALAVSGTLIGHNWEELSAEGYGRAEICREYLRE